MPPRYLHLDLPKHVMRNVSRFRLRAHTLTVESSIWRDGNGHCNKCSNAVQNEVHVFFHCQDLFVCSLRRKYLFLFFPFCQSFSMEAPYINIPCLVRLSYNLFSFSTVQQTLPAISVHTLYYFWAGKDRQQTNQPHDLAGS